MISATSAAMVSPGASYLAAMAATIASKVVFLFPADHIESHCLIAVDNAVESFAAHRHQELCSVNTWVIRSDLNLFVLLLPPLLYKINQTFSPSRFSFRNTVYPYNHLYA